MDVILSRPGRATGEDVAAAAAPQPPAPMPATPPMPVKKQGGGGMVVITAIAADEQSVASVEELLRMHGLQVSVQVQRPLTATSPSPVAVPPPVAAVADHTMSDGSDQALPTIAFSSPGQEDGAGSARGSYNNSYNATPDMSPRVDSANKRLSKKEYAQWAAATLGFRAEASAKYGGVAADSKQAAVLSAAKRGSGGGAADSHVHIAKGPDGSRGFGNRRLVA